jgi:signal transduction histidine kinase
MAHVKWDTLVTVPMVYGDNLVGVLISYHVPTRKIEEAELALHTAIANQAAVAVQNALLLTEVQGKAALEERQKLARELHDSVSQAIFSISLQARTAQTLLRGDPARVEEPLDHIASLSQAAMAEMRALIFELRPESLQNEGLIVAIAKQASALHARHNIEVETELCDEPPLTLEKKQVVFRIVQEALHNTVKHARASQVTIRLECDEQALTLEVIDDGIGFDPVGNFPGHLGLQSMRERAAKLGGRLQIESAPGRGACIRLSLPVS